METLCPNLHLNPPTLSLITRKLSKPSSRPSILSCRHRFSCSLLCLPVYFSSSSLQEHGKVVKKSTNSAKLKMKLEAKSEAESSFLHFSVDFFHTRDRQTPKSANPSHFGCRRRWFPGQGLTFELRITYVGGLPTWLLSKTQYVSDPRDVGAQTYMPFLFSPSQGIMPAQGWNSYMGNLNPTPTSLNLVAPTSIFGNNLVYNANDQSGPGINNPVNSLVANIPLLPQRPDQVDCRYFMSTGSCKYGADCKYHHPIERSAQFAINSLGPHGLPVRRVQMYRFRWKW